MIGYVKHFDRNKTMSFKVGDNNLLKKYNKILKKIGNIEFHSEPVYGDNDKYIKTNIKMYEDRVNTDFQDKNVPKGNASYKCLSLIMSDSGIRINKKCDPQTLLEECKYDAIKKNRMENLYDDLSSSVESDHETDNESDNETDSDESSDYFFKR